MELSTHMTFRPDARLDPEPTDLILISADHIQFHVHRSRILTASSNLLHLLLIYPDSTIDLTEGSEVVSIFLHCVYALPFLSQPSPDAILASFDTLKHYGMPLDRYVSPRTPLYEAALLPLDSQRYAIDLYAHAAQHNLHELATQASSALLSYPLATVTDDLARRMGPIYLRKLFLLHTERTKRLRHILASPPAAHRPTPECDSEAYRRFLGDWDLVTATMVLSAKPGKTTSHGIECRVQVNDS